MVNHPKIILEIVYICNNCRETFKFNQLKFQQNILMGFRIFVYSIQKTLFFIRKKPIIK